MNTEVKEEIEKQFGEVTEQDKKDYEEWISNPDNKARAISLAKEIDEAVGGKWFTINRLVKKTKLPEQEAFLKLSFANTFGFVLKKEEKIKEGGHWVNVSLFRIAIGNEIKIEEMKKAINYYEYQIEELNKQIQLLSKEG